MKPYLHELRHQLLSATVVGTVVVLALVGVGGGYSSTQVSLVSFEMAYAYSGGYHFMVYAIGSQGTAFGGALVQLWVNTTSVTPAPVAFVQNRTNARGLSALFASAGLGTYSYFVEVTAGSYSTGTAGEIGSGGFGGNESSSSEPAAFASVALGVWATSPSLSVLAISPTGGAPLGYEVRYVLNSSPYYPVTVYPERATTLLGSLSSAQTNLAWAAGYANPNTTFIQFEVFAPNGTYVGGSVLPSDALWPSGVSVAGSRATSFLTFVPPLVAVLGLMLGYVRYGKDRSLRTLESVLWRPVTRAGLFLVRLGSVLIALGAALALLLAALELWLMSSFGAGIPIGPILAIYGALLAEGAAFAGFVFLGANLLRSRGGVIAVAVVSFLLFGVFFSLLAVIIASVVAPTELSSFLAYAPYWNPEQLLIPTYAAIVPQAAGASSGVPGSGVLAGVLEPVTGNPGLLATVASAWGAVPAVIAFVLDHFRE
jgi:ABC-type transport system involved in multi-copper enzyme maturation permease subunit